MVVSQDKDIHYRPNLRTPHTYKDIDIDIDMDIKR